ncbi:phosphopyruvate hydratase [Nocardioides sp. InS609-2]|uniref:phosphopyruvate hydratase n=1 Tax=Nocardioides sp. InS609-2 TaxID=2760705 RepID=UPI0020BD7395|nr:phosphopyruvate hydratase [Nocardioides sp. InS609-2]
MSITPTSLTALEILDSRGRPTLLVQLETSAGDLGRAGVPSGASTGSGEAVELRDRDATRYDGNGVLTAVSHVDGEIADALVGRTFLDQSEVDAALIELDGTPDKSRLGANAIVGVSMAAARAFAATRGTALWRQLTVTGESPRLPVPHFNVVNGGAHAANPLDFQEFMLAPLGAPSYAEALRAGAEVYARLRRRLADAGHATGLGDEGGFAPDLAHPDQVLELLVAAIGDAGYETGDRGVAIALDPAASEFRRNGLYTVADQRWSSQELVSYYQEMVDRFPVRSIEDGVGEDDDEGWRLLTERLGERIQLVGDDNFVTNPRIIERAIADGIANAALIKVNQIGTVSETLEAMTICRRHGYAAMVSHRSGETPDTFIADLAVGTGCGQLKAGAPARGERTAKYNRLLEISLEGPDLGFGRP